jgi:hypothetical protein
MRSPVGAMLWENWRLSRIEMAQRAGLSLVGGAAALLMMERGTWVAFWILLTLHAFFYMSIARLNGGRFIDGYKPGFPFYLYYTRPQRTFVFVGAAMAYDALTAVTSYVVCATVLGLAFGKPLPIFPMVPFLVTFHMAYLAVQWATRQRSVQWVGSIVISWPPFLLLVERAKALPQIGFSHAEHAVMALICVASFLLTVAGVARQRCGDAIASVPRKARSSGYPQWLIDLFRFPCPTVSATRAQVWYELRSSALPILGIGLSIAIVVFVLYAIGIVIAPLRAAAVAAPIMFGLPALLFVFGSNAFGIRRKQGRTYFSTFEATQPYGTAQMAGLKILVRTVAVFAALIAVGASVWLSGSLMSAWGSWQIEGKDTLPQLLETRHKIGASFGALSAHIHLAQAALLAIAVAATVTTFASFSALRARYPRRVLVVGALLLLDALALVLLGWAAKSGFASKELVLSIVGMTLRTVAACVVFGTVYLAWRLIAERLLRPRQAAGVALVVGAIGTAWLMLLHALGVSRADVSAAEAVWVLSPALLPLIFAVLAPWSLSRIRHT